jgi:hypothetical protein
LAGAKYVRDMYEGTIRCGLANGLHDGFPNSSKEKKQEAVMAEVGFLYEVGRYKYGEEIF